MPRSLHCFWLISRSMFIDGLTIGGDNSSWCEKLKYLGIMFKSGKHLMCEFDLCIRRFYTAAKSIYDNNRFASEMSKLQLMKSFCLPLLSYGCEVLYASITFPVVV